jgi:hypothetical protein
MILIINSVLIVVHTLTRRKSSYDVRSTFNHHFKYTISPVNLDRDHPKTHRRQALSETELR